MEAIVIDEKLVMQAPSGKQILKKCEEITELLLRKNISYGNSALEPIGIFSNLSSEDAIKVRLDDKLNRIKNKQEFNNEDTVLDLVGYLVLLLVSRDL